jgi:hypothetical protein
VRLSAISIVRSLVPSPKEAHEVADMIIAGVLQVYPKLSQCLQKVRLALVKLEIAEERFL